MILAQLTPPAADPVRTAELLASTFPPAPFSRSDAALAASSAGRWAPAHRWFRSSSLARKTGPPAKSQPVFLVLLLPHPWKSEPLAAAPDDSSCSSERHFVSCDHSPEITLE